MSMPVLIQVYDEMRRLACAEQKVYFLDEGPSEEQDPRGYSAVLGLGDWVPCDQELIQRELGRAIRQMVDALPPREGYIVQKHFGMGTSADERGCPEREAVSHRALAVEMKVSPERIRQLQRRAIQRLRQAVAARPELHQYAV